ncbi:MAG: elongation factor P [Patescibacteria group bacterium]
MSRITTADFHKGMFITFKNEPHQIVEFQHVNPGKGSAFVRSRLKSFKTGRVQEFTFKAGEEVEDLSINTREMQYLYKEGDNFVFMDNKSYEQMSVSKTVLGEYANYLKENETYQLLVFEDQAIGVRFPKKVRLTVVETEDAVKGNTVSGATKPAKLETGVSVQVPLFIKTGDVIGIDPETGEYVDRVTG